LIWLVERQGNVCGQSDLPGNICDPTRKPTSDEHDGVALKLVGHKSARFRNRALLNLMTLQLTEVMTEMQLEAMA
jgi:hypothetical protein